MRSPMTAVRTRTGICVLTAAFAFAVAAAPSASASHATASALPPLDSAGTFLLSEVSAKVGGDWSRAWQSLYPGHQRVAPFSTFVRCERATPFPAPLKSIRVLRARPDLVRVPGLARPLAGAAVTVGVSLRWYGTRDPIAWTHTFHLVAVNGRWAWLLSPSRYELYRNGCVAAPAI